MTDKHPDFPYTDVKEVARIIMKSLPMEESNDKTKQNKKNPNKIYQPSNQNQTETTNKVSITKSACGVLSLKTAACKSNFCSNFGTGTP